MLDVTNNATRFWLQNRLRKLHSSYNIDAFSLDLGIVHYIWYLWIFENCSSESEA